MPGEPLNASVWDEVCWEGQRWRRATALEHSTDPADQGRWIASWNVGGRLVGEAVWAAGATEDAAKANLTRTLGFDPWALMPALDENAGCG